MQPEEGEDIIRVDLGNGKFGKINVDNSPSVAQKYNVRSIPYVLIISNGEVKEQVVGNVPEADISALLNKLV